MAKMRKIGIMVEALGLGIWEGATRAAQLGADGIQVWVTAGDMSPLASTPTTRRAYAKHVSDCGLVISAVCADLGAFTDPEQNPKRVAASKACMDVAVDLGTRVVTTHIGHVPDDAADPRYQACLVAVRELAEYAEARGLVFATETGPEPGSVLGAFLREVGRKSAMVNFDPANLIMSGFDHLQGVRDLAPFIAHTHAKDGVLTSSGPAEVPLGQGSVNFPAYLRELDAAGYGGFLTIERETGEDPAADVAAAVRFLRGELK